VKRSLVASVASVALSLTLLAAVVPAVLAAEPAASQSATPAPTDDGTPPDGEISVDPTFVAPTPSGAVLAATGRPDPTLPPTDAITMTASSGGTALLALLIVLLAAVSVLVLLVGRLPDARRR